MTATNRFAVLPVEIFSNILEYLDWSDLGRLDTALINRFMRNGYLGALKIRKMKVERNEFLTEALDR